MSNVAINGIGWSQCLLFMAAAGIVFVSLYRRHEQPRPPVGIFTVLSLGSLLVLGVWPHIPHAPDPNVDGGICYENFTLALLAGIIFVLGVAARTALARRGATRFTLAVTSVITGVVSAAVLISMFMSTFSSDGRVCINELNPTVPVIVLFIGVLLAIAGLFRRNVPLPVRLVTLTLTVTPFALLIVFLVILGSHCC